jgi:hypothetical protein
MNNTIKVKKWIERSQEQKIIRWEYWIIDLDTWEIVYPDVNTSKYNLKLSNNKTFMKKWTDRKLNMEIKKNLSLLEKGLLFDILDYVDEHNIINMKLIANDFWYSPSKMSKGKRLLEDKMIIKKQAGIYYLNPIVWIKSKNISQELIDLFKESFDMYWVDINL